MKIPSTETENNKYTRLFRIFGIATVFAVFFLILVGGIVRTTGAGMGCPDWPKCFGRWIPPTDVSQLPTDYKEIFSTEFHQVADFSVLKTWTEYINRLLGVSIGILVFITMVLSFSYRKTRSIITYMSISGFLLVAFVGWLGARVVASNLLPGIITLHMLGAVLVVATLIISVARSYQEQNKSLLDFRNTQSLRTIWIFCTILAFVQLILGTQVRESIDEIAIKYGNTQRDLWISDLSLTFYIHRSTSLLFLVLSYLMYRKTLQSGNTHLIFWSKVHFGMGILAMLLGVILAYLSVPAFAQPLHLLTGTLICGILIYTGTILYPGKSQVISATEYAS